MIRLLKFTSCVLLLINGVGALYGGINIIVDPSGSSLNLDLSLRARAPFHTYLIPGIVLFITNGVLSFVALYLVLKDSARYPVFLIVQGLLLIVWMIVQLIIVPGIVMMQVVMAMVGLALFIIGALLIQSNTRKAGGKVSK